MKQQPFCMICVSDCTVIATLPSLAAKCHNSHKPSQVESLSLAWLYSLIASGNEPFHWWQGLLGQESIDLVQQGYTWLSCMHSMPIPHIWHHLHVSVYVCLSIYLSIPPSLNLSCLWHSMSSFMPDKGDTWTPQLGDPFKLNAERSFFKLAFQKLHPADVTTGMFNDHAQ